MNETAAATAAWHDIAIRTREALDKLNYPIKPRCLPGEPDECGGTDYEHVCAHLGTLAAVIDDRIRHLHEGSAQLIAAEVRAHVAAELAAQPSCETKHA